MSTDIFFMAKMMSIKKVFLALFVVFKKIFFVH
jgi:hypothetical protein